MKPASYRLSLLAGCAAFTFLTAQPALAFAPSEPLPSIEIHLDVLSGLAAGEAPRPLMAADAPETMTGGGASPFGKPSAPLKDARTEPLRHAEAPMAAGSRPMPRATITATKAARARKETQVADAAPGVSEFHAHANDASKDVPPPLAASAMTPVAKPLPPEAAVPKPDVKTLAAEPVAAPVAAPAPAVAANVPKLPETEVRPAAPVPQKPGAAADIGGGLAEVLGDEADKPMPAAKPSPSLSAEDAPMAASSHTLTPPPAPPLPTASLATPPAELTAAVPPPRELPHLPEDTSPSLASVPETRETPSGKMVMASNDMPALPTHPPVALDSGKPDLPGLPSAESPAPQEMAQATIVPLAIPPSMHPPAPSVPDLPPIATPSPAPASATVPPALTPAPASTPAAAQVPSGPAPDLRIVFNESATDVPLGSTGQLDALAATLNSNPADRVTIMAYASGPETTGIYPKRVSLARGIAIRNYLTSNKGVDIERVNVKALGNKEAGTGPGDRVDLFILK